jgi:hypothetical protein
LTIADTEIVGPPQAVKVAGTDNAEFVPGRVTDRELTTGQVCSPSEGTSLDCTRKPTVPAPLGGSVSEDGAMENVDPSPVL